MELAAFALGVITNLLSSVIYDEIKSQGFFLQRKIKARVEAAAADVVEPLLPFLKNEGISEDKQRRLFETCVEELRHLTEKPELLFQGSLNGQKIFDELYVSRVLPQVIIEDDLQGIYSLLCPRIATLLCKIPSAVRDWENEAWSENFRRFDEITKQLCEIFYKVDELSASSSKDTDTLLIRTRQVLAQKIRLELDLTGLRGDSPRAGKFNDFFIHPQISEIVKAGGNWNEAKIINTSQESFDLFTIPTQRGILIGQPGAGKSTWAKWLQIEALSTKWNGLCIRVELRRFSDEKLLSVHDLVREAASQHLAEELTADRISQWLKANKVVFILDGFDEIRPSDRDKIYEWIIELSSAIQKCPCLLTSRPLTTDHLERLNTTWKSWNIDPFDQKRIVDYIQRWYSYISLLLESDRKIDANSLALDWIRDPTISPLTSNPLLLSTLLMVHHLDGSLPSGRSELYRRYVEGMLGLWDERRKVTATSIQLSLEYKRRIIRSFALQMFLDQKDQLDENAALNLFKNVLDELNISLSEEDVLNSFRERSGLIIGPGIYSFVHKSVLEYLVSECVLQGDKKDSNGAKIDRFRLFKHRDDDRWNTVTFLWAGLAPIADVESFIDECITAKEFRLAGGILYDQYSKFQVDVRRQMLLRILHEGQKSIVFSRHSFWDNPYMASRQIELLIPHFSLRHLVSLDVSLHDLLDRAVKERIISWSDNNMLEGDVRDILWMCCINTIENLEEWKQCLISQPPSSADEKAWLNWALHSSLYQSISTDNLKRLIDILMEDFCNIHELLPFALMSIGISPGVNNIPPAMLKLLTSINHIKIDKELLLGTREWMIFTGQVQDLLFAFLDEMESLLIDGKLQKDDTYHQAVDFVKSLIQQRHIMTTPV
jgi:NACHT domain